MCVCASARERVCWRNLCVKPQWPWSCSRCPVFAPKCRDELRRVSPWWGRQHTHGSQQRLNGTSASVEKAAGWAPESVCATSPHANIVFVRPPARWLCAGALLSRRCSRPYPARRALSLLHPTKWPVSCPPMERRLLIRIRGAFPAVPSLRRCRQRSTLLCSAPNMPNPGEKGESKCIGALQTANDGIPHQEQKAANKKNSFFVIYKNFLYYYYNEIIRRNCHFWCSVIAPIKMWPRFVN